jgi:hypothetical protein
VFNDLGFDTLKKKFEGLYTIIILERWVGINTHE